MTEKCYFQFRGMALGSLCAFALAVSLYSPGGVNAAELNNSDTGAASADCKLLFNPPALYDTGFHTAVALHPSGLAVEVHQSQYTGMPQSV